MKLFNISNITKIDIPLLLCYLLLIFAGWFNIYSALYTEESAYLFDFTQRYGMQFIWILTSFAIAIIILFFINHSVYSVLSPLIYAGVILLLILVIFIGKEVNGSKSWFQVGPISFQPAEISKISTSLLLAYFMREIGFKFKNISITILTGAIILFPMILIILEKETGSALVYCGFIFVLYREGLKGIYLIFGIVTILLFVLTLKYSPIISLIALTLLFGAAMGILRKSFIKTIATTLVACTAIYFLPYLFNLNFMSSFAKIISPEVFAMAIILVLAALYLYKLLKKNILYARHIFFSLICSIVLIFSVNWVFNNILQHHQRARIENLLGLNEDITGIGYNVYQSKIAIGSGGLMGKGYLQGTQTKFNFVPEQSTDFIFCTIGEEWGFFGSTIIIAIYLFMIGRIILLAEKQKDNFSRIYGYCVASCIFMHVFINIGMTIGLVPVIGIPLPFVSYGGSSLWTFTALLFIFLRLDLQRFRTR